MLTRTNIWSVSALVAGGLLGYETATGHGPAPAAAGRQAGAREEPPKTFSPYADRPYSTRAYWGETHLHTSFSPDAGLVGDRLSPDEGFRLARGQQIRTSTDQLIQLVRPYDWLCISDHATYLGLPQAFAEGDPEILKTETGKKWAEALKKGGQAGYDAFVQMTKEFAVAKGSIPREAQAQMYRTIWDRAIDAAERNNKPGVFTAFNGFEWTQSVRGNNLHRTVVFRDGSAQTKEVIPFTEFDSADPEDLWKYMADYEKKTTGHMLAVEHNPNLSCGQMFAPKTWTGKPFDKKYAETRARFDRLVEASQCKGDSETTTQLSPNDQFADFDVRWNKTNIFGLIATTPEMLPYNYCRSALKLGLEHQSKLGVNPFKFGLIGASDNHTSLSTTRAENYFGMGTIAEPKPDRWKELFMKSEVSPKLNMYMWECLPGGLTGVWAKENTREGVFDALYRKEVYCTSGTRPTCACLAAGTLRPSKWPIQTPFGSRTATPRRAHGWRPGLRYQGQDPNLHDQGAIRPGRRLSRPRADH